MKSISGFLMAILVALTAHAQQAFVTESPAFSFQSAQESFETARVPAIEETVGKWFVVGKVHKSSVSADGYWPDGKFQFPDWGAGYYKENVTISAPQIDAFGKPYVALTDKIVGVETGKVYQESAEPSRGVATSAGIKFKFGDSVTGTCRIFQATGMFLCEKADSAGQPIAYYGMKKAN